MAYDVERIPYPIVFQERSSFKDTYAGSMDAVFLESQLIRPKGLDSKTAIVFMHPIGGGAWLPMVGGLAAAGHHVIYCNSRYRGVDSALIMEKCVVDLGQCIQHAKRKFGYETIILGGWSGGGSLSLFYQAEAEDPTVRSTPWGDPPDLTQAGLVPADGILLLAAHVSRATTFTEWLDASILDESDPAKKDRSLDLYDSEHPNQPPYSDAFLETYRAAQIARNRRITAWVRQKLQSFRDAGKPNDEFGFVVHGTMADPRWLDPGIDPNQREAGTCYLGDPRVVNNSPVGLARFCSLRSWLSQWSYDESRADGVACAARISIPALVIGNLADNACTPSHTHRLYEAISHEDKVLHEIDGATHYYINQPEQLKEAVGLVSGWIGAHRF